METLYALLKVGWTEGNTNDRTPNFIKRAVGGRANWESTDVVLIYDKAHTDEDVGIMHNHTTFTHHCSVEVRSPRARRQVMRMKNEVDRILNKYTHLATCYVEYLSASDNDSADWNYDEIEKAGSNIPFDAKDGTRMVMEFRLIKYWVAQHT